MNTKQGLYNYALRLADSSLIMAQRLTEWCSNGPILEEDLALTNIALDYFGQAENFYQFCNKLDDTKSPDELAFLRSEREYLNSLICEIPNQDYAVTMTKLYLFSGYLKLLYYKLKNSVHEDLAGLAAKSYKEVVYHEQHSRDWLIRFGKGTEESKKRAQNAINNLWMFTNDLFDSNETDDVLNIEEWTPKQKELYTLWQNQIKEFFEESMLTKPDDGYQLTGGYSGVHTEHLGHLLCEMQYLQRAYPGAVWQ